MAINSVQILGNCGRDPDIRTMNSGDRVATLSVATTDKWTDKQTGEIKEATEWHRVVVFGKGLIDKVIEPYVHKGSQVFVGGKLKTREWTDNDGITRRTTEIVVQFGGQFELCGRRSNDAPPPDSAEEYGAAPAARSASAPPRPRGDDLDDDIPF